MSRECLKHYVPMLNESLKEKSKIAEAASSTLQKLNSVMKQIRELREDRAKLKSNIWKLKSTLQDSKEPMDQLNLDPMLHHQKEEIKRLEETNQSLEIEIAKLRNVLATTEENIAINSDWKFKNKLVKIQEEFSGERKSLNDEISRLKKRLKETEKENKNTTLTKYKNKLLEIERGDQTMEIIFTNVASKVAETVAHLSEELVNTSEDLYQSKSLNDNLLLEIDRLHAVLRIQTGDNIGYKKRINEIEMITQKLKAKSSKLKNLSENPQKEISENLCSPKFVESIEYLFKDLKFKLRNDYEAIIAAGDLNSANYIKRIIDLHSYLKNVQKKIQGADLSSYETKQDKITTVKLEETLIQVRLEIDKLKMDRINQCKVINVEGPKFLKKIYEIEEIIEKTEVTVTKLNKNKTEINDYQKLMKNLDELISNLCTKVQELEDNVAFQESATVIEKNEELKSSVAKLKLDSDEKNNCIQKLEEKLQEKIQELDNLQGKLTKLSADNKILKEETSKKDKMFMELSSDLQNLRKDKSCLMMEAEKSRNMVLEKNEKIFQKDATEKVLKSQVDELKYNLSLLMEENSKLDEEINELKKEKKVLQAQNNEKFTENVDNIKQLQNCIETTKTELDQLKMELHKKIIELEKADSRNGFLRDRLAEFDNEKGRLESDIINLISCKESLKCQLDVEKQNLQKLSKELEEATSYNRTFQNQVFTLQSQNDTLKAEVIELRARRDYLKMTLEDMNKKRTNMEEQVRDFRSNWMTLVKETGLLEIHLDQSNEIGCEAIINKIKTINLENTRLNNEIYDMVLKWKELENQNQLLIAENNQLVVRATEQKDEIDALTEKLDKINEEKENLFISLNESKMENNTLQEMTNELKRLIEDLRAKSNIPDRDQNILCDQYMPGINADRFKKLRNSFQYSDCNTYLNVFDATSKTFENEEIMQNFSQNGHLTHIEPNGKGLTFLLKNCNPKLDSDANSSDNENIQQNPMMEQLKSTIENDSFRLELADSDARNIEAKLELSRIQLRSEKLATDAPVNETAIKSALDKVDLINFNWTKKTNSVESNFEPPLFLNEFYKARNGTIILHNEHISTQEKNQTTESLIIIEELKIENSTLKKEVNILRSGIRIVFEKYQKIKGDYRCAIEELRALKLELAISRNEKKELQIQINANQLELNRLNMEKTALKEELMCFRKSTWPR